MRTLLSCPEKSDPSRQALAWGKRGMVLGPDLEDKCGRLARVECGSQPQFYPFCELQSSFQQGENPGPAQPPAICDTWTGA